ncbi:C1D-domain-containing protein [Panus rudis PR-1116 ss-1]|nr:C1D-domain-containing protein [Panus rudis PR-1116 ss-1]
MTENPTRIRAKLGALHAALEDLETKLEPLLSQSLPETLVGLDTIQQAKLQVAIPYLVYDLVFVYLKTRGIDPKTHPVIHELDRIRQYFDKIKNAEDPDKRKNVVDKAAANRFIKHAIAQVANMRPTGDNEPGPSHIRFTQEGQTKEDIPVKVTSKMLARAQYEKELKELGSEEEDDLEVFEENDDEDEEMDNAEETQDTRSAKAKGKAKAIETSQEPQLTSEPVTGKKRRRPQMDPFAGYGDAPEGSNASTPRTGTPKLSDDVASSGRSTPQQSSDAASRDKKAAKNAAKKARKKAKRMSSGS